MSAILNPGIINTPFLRDGFRHIHIFYVLTILQLTFFKKNYSIMTMLLAIILF